MTASIDGCFRFEFHDRASYGYFEFSQDCSAPVHVTVVLDEREGAAENVGKAAGWRETHRSSSVIERVFHEDSYFIDFAGVVVLTEENTSQPRASGISSMPIFREWAVTKGELLKAGSSAIAMSCASTVP